jgi:hypothetical protein
VALWQAAALLLKGATLKSKNKPAGSVGEGKRNTKGVENGFEKRQEAF